MSPHRVFFYCLAMLTLITLACVTGQRRDQVRAATRIYLPFDNSMHVPVGGDLIESAIRVDRSAAAGLLSPGIHGSALALHGQPVDLALRRAFSTPDSKGGWSGAASWWLKLEQGQLSACRPFQLLDGQAPAGALWLEITKAKDAAGFSVTAGVSRCAEGFSSVDSPAESVLNIPNARLASGSWYHFALVWANVDHKTADAWLALYFGGELAGTIKQQRLEFGCDWTSVVIRLGEGCQGALDELAIFGRPLSISEIRLLGTQPGLLSQP